eukprot:3599297-Alexandrium_andersonii.AAC.1
MKRYRSCPLTRTGSVRSSYLDAGEMRGETSSASQIARCLKATSAMRMRSDSSQAGGGTICARFPNLRACIQPAGQNLPSGGI